MEFIKQAEAVMPTNRGKMRMMAYAETPQNPMPHIVMVHELTDFSKPVPVRIHSECMTGDLFHSNRCDCGEQLEKALDFIAEKGGILIYLRQEGRGIGLINKLKAYNLQDEGLNTADANTHLGFEVDARNYDLAVRILEELGVKKIQLLTNNPDKIEAFEHAPVELVSRIPLKIKPRTENQGYLNTKRELMGHFL
ncbi:MAG: GTP cyclohydrolase II [Bacteroidetes bacterium]|nr:MAG: GTP cyclohydrolase II [Bacteroidota bacterium]